MNTEKIEKLKKSLSNSKIPADLKPKIEAEIKRLEDLDEKKSVKPKELVEPVATKTTTRKPRAKKPVASKRSVKKTSQTKTTKPTAMSLAKEIRKDGESWNEAIVRASEMMKDKSKKATKDAKEELDELSKIIKKRKELRSQVGLTDMLRDAKRKALPSGRRISESGEVYYENRANRTDKGSYGKYYLEEGGKLSNYRIFEGYDNYKSIPLYQVIDVSEDGEYDGEWHTNRADAEKELKELENNYSVGGKLKTPFNVIYTTKSGRTMVARNIMALDEEQAKDKLKQEMRASDSFDKILMAHKSFELGGTVLSDLAGHTGGSFGTGDPNMLDNVSGTAYTGLVAETGAMSSGEMFELGGGVGKVEHYPLDKEKLNENAEWYANRIKSGSQSTTKKDLIERVEEYKKDLFLLEIGRKKPSNIIGTGYKGNTKKIANTWLLEQIYKTNKIIELLGDKYELGGEMATDLAGHIGGSFGTGDPSMLNGVSGTDYSGLVGETGAMSSGEMFMNGGGLPNGVSQSYMVTEAFGNPAQHYANGGGLPDGAEQSYINYYLGEGSAQGIYKKGGSIPNNYEGRTPEDIWNNLTIAQRKHFLSDHSSVIKYVKRNKKGMTDYNLLTDEIKHENSDWKNLDSDIKLIFKEHVQEGQYAYGGKTKSRPSMRELYIEQIAFATNTRKEGVDNFAKEHNLTDSELSNLMTGIGRKIISQSDFVTSLVGNKNNSKQKEVVAFAKSDKAYKMFDGGEFDSEEEVTYFINKDGIKVRSMVEPDEKLPEIQWFAKHIDSKEARAYAFGGLFGKAKESMMPKKYPKLDEKQVKLKTGELVMVLDQSGDTLMVMELDKLGTGERPKTIKISEVDETSFAKGGGLDMQDLKFAIGGFVNWQKYPTKKVRGLYEIKGDGIDSKVNIVSFERYDDELYSLYPLDKDKHLFKEILVKSTVLNSLDKGIIVKGETNDGKKVSIKRIINQDFNETSFADGGSLSSGSINALGDLWFAVQQKDTDDYKMLSQNLDELNVPFIIQNEVSADAESQRGRKALNIPEVHDRIKKIVEKNGRKFAKGGGFEKLSKSVAKNYEGKSVKPKYQKEYGKVYSKEEAKEVGDKVAGKLRAKQKMATGGETKKETRGGIMTLAKQIRKEGESWQDALKRAGQQLK
jgi:hypothetical protein